MQAQRPLKGSASCLHGQLQAVKCPASCTLTAAGRRVRAHLVCQLLQLGNSCHQVRLLRKGSLQCALHTVQASMRSTRQNVKTTC